jgi:hypothetical protein
VVKSERGSRMASPLLVTIILPLPTAQKRRKWKKTNKKGKLFKKSAWNICWKRDRLPCQRIFHLH